MCICLYDIYSDLQRQRSSTTHVQTQYQEQNIRLKEQLQHALSDVRHLQQLNETQQLEIETLETRNEQIGTNASEMIDDLSRELAEERDGLSTLKHKYSKLRNEQTKLKINYEKRGTEINNLKKQIQEKDLKIQLLANANDTVKTKTNEEAENMNKHQIKLLYRQIDNYKDEMEGISKHLEHCKQYLKTTMHHLESVGLLMQSPLDETQDGPTIETLYNHCKNARQFLGIFYMLYMLYLLISCIHTTRIYNIYIYIISRYHAITSRSCISRGIARSTTT